MSIEAIANTVRTTFYNEFAIAQPTIEMYFENQRRDNNDNEHWVMFTLIPGDTRRADIGNQKNFRTMGAVNVQVMIPAEAGSSTGLGIVDSVQKILLDRVIPIAGGGQIVLYGSSVANRGLVNGWHSFSVKCEFRADTQIER